MNTGRVAQLVERQSNKLPVEGSSPFVTIFALYFQSIGREILFIHF
jgi:hypothetical protein